MPQQKIPVKSREKEDLKLELIRLTKKYSLFEGSVPAAISERMRLQFDRTIKELFQIISAL